MDGQTIKWKWCLMSLQRTFHCAKCRYIWKITKPPMGRGRRRDRGRLWSRRHWFVAVNVTGDGDSIAQARKPVTVYSLDKRKRINQTTFSNHKMKMQCTLGQYAHAPLYLRPTHVQNASKNIYGRFHAPRSQSLRLSYSEMSQLENNVTKREINSAGKPVNKCVANKKIVSIRFDARIVEREK